MTFVQEEQILRKKVGKRLKRSCRSFWLTRNIAIGENVGNITNCMLSNELESTFPLFPFPENLGDE